MNCPCANLRIGEKYQVEHSAYLGVADYTVSIWDLPRMCECCVNQGLLMQNLAHLEPFSQYQTQEYCLPAQEILGAKDTNACTKMKLVAKAEGLFGKQ